MLLVKYALGSCWARIATSADTLTTPRWAGEQPPGPCASISEMSISEMPAMKSSPMRETVQTRTWNEQSS
jgi:hypothetical protein